MSLLDSLDPVLKPWAFKLYDLAVSAGVHPRVTSGRRTYAQQQALYEAWIHGRSKIEAAAPGGSAHEYGLAFDMLVPSSIDQADLRTVWRSWGGITLENDPVHFEYPGFTRGAPRATAPSETQSQTIADTRRKAEQVADLILNTLPVPLRGILNTGVIVAQFFSIFGSEAAAAIDWLFVHPAEAIDFFYEVMWGRLKALVGL